MAQTTKPSQRRAAKGGLRSAQEAHHKSTPNSSASDTHFCTNMEIIIPYNRTRNWGRQEGPLERPKSQRSMRIFATQTNHIFSRKRKITIIYKCSHNLAAIWWPHARPKCVICIGALTIFFQKRILLFLKN